MADRSRPAALAQRSHCSQLASGSRFQGAMPTTARIEQLQLEARDSRAAKRQATTSPRLMPEPDPAAPGAFISARGFSLSSEGGGAWQRDRQLAKSWTIGTRLHETDDGPGCGLKV